MPIHDNQEEFRRFFVQSVAEKAALFSRKIGIPVEFTASEETIDKFVWEYRTLRNQLADFHDVKQPALFRNYKIAACFIFLMSREPAERFFTFEQATPDAHRRQVMGSMMVNVAHSLCLLKRAETQTDLELIEDLEYCLIRELPRNLEFLCLTLHALCAALGKKTDLERY